MNKNLKSFKKEIRISMAKYIFPSVMSLLLTAFYVIVDGIFIGIGAGEEGLAAINIGYPLVNISNGFSLMFGIGGSTLISIYSRNKKIKNIFFTSIIFLCISFYLLLLSAVFLSGDKLIYMIGSSESLLPQVKMYLYPLTIGSIFLMLTTAMIPILRNINAPRYAFFSMSVGAITNIILDWIFILKFNMGIRGASIATVIGQIFSFSSIAIFFIIFNTGLHFNLKKMKLKIFLKIISVGFSSCLLETAIALILIIFNIKFMYYGGQVAVSAFCIVAYIYFIARMLFTGVAQGIQPLLSYNYGIKNYEKIYIFFKETYKLNIFLSFAFFLLLNIFAKQIISIFGATGELLNLTIHGFRIYSLAVFFSCFNLLNISYLQSIDRARSSIFISLINSFIFLIIFSNLLPIFLGMDGIWFSFPLSDFMSLLTTYLLRKKLSFKIQQ